MTLADRLRHLVRRVHPLTDGEPDHLLLTRFAQTRDESSFAELVRRHGPMVLGVCRRIVRNEHDAEDAFQAAFLVLARRAGSIRLRGSVGDWMFGVARRTALAARRASARRSARETTAPPTVNDAPVDQWELRAVLDEELSRLPERYRSVLVLADLEGKDRRQVAAELMVPEGTVASRLSRGRVMLAARLTRRGWGPAAVGGMVVVPAALEAATVGAGMGQEVRTGATVLAERVVTEMSRKKLAVATVVAAVVVGGGLAGLTAAGPGSGSPTTGPAEFSVSHAGGTTLLLNPTTGETWVLNQPAGAQPAWVPVKRAEQTPPAPAPAKSAGGNQAPPALEMAGTLQPLRSAKVHPPWPGILAKVSVRVGDAVKSGQVLGALDDTQARLAVEAAEADLQKAKAARPLGKAGEVPLREVNKAEAEILRAEVGVKQAQLRLKEAQLIAPFDGTVIEVTAAVGDAVRPDGSPVLQIATLRDMEAVVNVPEREVVKVSVGQECVVRVSGDGAEYPAVVYGVGAVVDQATATVAVRAKVKLPEGAVSPRVGSFVVVRFAGKK